MKTIILYILLFFFAIGCKTDIKQTAQIIENNIVKVDTVKTKKQIAQERSKNLKNKFIGKPYGTLKEFIRLNNYSSGGFYFEGQFEESYGGIFSFRGKNDKIEFIIFKINNIIMDIIDIDNDIDPKIFNPNKETVIFDDVLRNGKKAPELFALAAYEEAEVMTEVYKVWRANLKTGKIEELKDLSNITVIDEDF